MLTPAEIFRSYRSERCFLDIPQYRAERLPHLVRYTPVHKAAGGIVMFASLKPDQVQQAVAEQIEYFKIHGLDFEWKVYDFDQPDNLQARLAAFGFVGGEAEAFMVCQTERWQGSKAANKPWRIKRIVTEQGIADIVGIQQHLYKRDFGWLHQQLLEVLTLAPATQSLYCAYSGDTPVGSGWTDFPAGSGFAELHGGAVLPDWRGNGVYRDLYNIRMAEIAERGFRLVAVDAAPMSRPILEKLGFTCVCATVPMQFSLKSQSGQHGLNHLVK